jgi:hypothetical protein
VLTATDSAGNSSSAAIHGGVVKLTQDGGTTDQSDYVASIPRLSYKGAWSVARCGCWMAGQVHKTAKRGSSVTLRSPTWTRVRCMWAW